jgi:TPR repeat protein
MNRLAGLLYTRQEYAEAESWFREAADRGDVVALTNLGAMVAGRDPELAEQYFRTAAEAGDPGAMHNLASSLYERRHGEAMLWYLKAAQRGYVRSMCTLALELKDVQLDEARRWAILAARADDGSTAFAADSMVELGRLAEDDDPTAAKHWYARAADAVAAGDESQ